MPNIDKVVKTAMHEISEGKAVVREVMSSALKNQEIIIAQNKCITNLLAEINDNLSTLATEKCLGRKHAEMTNNEDNDLT